MTDAELIQLVQEKGPEDLSAEEIGLLRQRLLVSAQLRDVLFDQLQLEQSLSQALGRVNVSVDAIFTTALLTDKRPNRTAALLGWGFCFGVSVLALIVWLMMKGNAQEVAKNERDPASVEE